MAMLFPTNPNNGDQANGYTFDSAKGAWLLPGSTVSMVIPSPTAPVGAADNVLWLNTETGALLVRYNDGTSTQWVEPRKVGDLWLEGRIAALETAYAGRFDASKMAAGSVVQVVMNRYPGRPVFTFSSNTVISWLNTSITPKFANSMLIAQFNLTYESNYNGVFRAMRDNALITDSGYWGYNNEDYSRWSGISPIAYDTDVASTPNSQLITYYVPAKSTATTTLQLCLNQSAGGTETFALNRSFNNIADNYEEGVSYVTIWEIAQ